ncbi:MAG TPA: chromosome segregation protein SMC [Roseiflexaceae bacterium]|nr:chromosome segregation protein SMC [Roseiflexaceae bacterium]
MHLRRLEIQGFKTFAPRTVFEFGPGITAVVGPNGSGKTNVVDAVRWVLGEQSYATLRSKRTEDLIFGGGSRRAPAGFAEVSLTIDNHDRLINLPYDEVTLTRRATRAGDSEYFINRNRVRLRDLHEAVGALGGSYTIINQGLVDAALNLRPEERRRLFEDAAAIGVFESRRAETERRLRETDANMQRSADILAELEPRLRSLKRQASLAQSARDLHTELSDLLVGFYAAQQSAARAALATARTAAAAAAAALAQCQAERTAHAAGVAGIRQALQGRREELGTLHAESSTLHSRAQRAQRDLAVSNERQTALERRAAEQARAAAELLLRQEELHHEAQATADRLAEAEQRLAEQHQLVAELEHELQTYAAQRRTFQQQLDAARRAELEIAATAAEHARRAEQLHRRRDQLLHEHEHHAATLAAAEQTLAQRQAQATTAQAQAEQATARLATAQATLQAATAELDERRAVRSRADEAVAAARRTLADAEARLESLTRLQRSYAGTFAGVKAAMQWAATPQRPGFALVSSIIRAPAELETAVEVTLGARLQHIVVEQWVDAEAAIAALKRDGVGRATFLPLDTIRRPGVDRRPDLTIPGILGVAADLVEFDPPYQAVVTYLLGRTLVVGELADARRALAALRHNTTSGWNIVTLAGEQLSSGGALTGGAASRESGTLRRERELRDLPEIVARAQAALTTARQQHAAAEQASAAAETQRRTAEQLARSQQHEAEHRQTQAENARRAAERAAADLALHHRRRDQIAADLAELATHEQTLQIEQAAAEQAATTIHRNSAELAAAEQAFAAEDHQRRRRLDAIRTAAAATAGEARAERALLQAHQQGLARLAEQAAAARRHTESIEHERRQLTDQHHAIAAEHTTLLSRIDALRRVITPREAELTSLEQQHSGLEQQTELLQLALHEAETAAGRMTLDVHRAVDRLDLLTERAAADQIDLDTLPQSSPASDTDHETLQERIRQLRLRIQRLGAVNPLALEEYAAESERYTFLTTQIDDLQRATAALRTLIDELDSAMHARFETTFHAVAAEFEQTFAQLFGGGQAQLVLTNGPGDTPLNGNGHIRLDTIGVEIVARPPGKRQQTLALLSGGERSLTAVALLFAILKVNPSPFCLLDEVDAALDETNVGRFRDALAGLAQQTQFLVVTHNRGTIEVADTIYGISMNDDGASRVLSLRLEEIQ